MKSTPSRRLLVLVLASLLSPVVNLPAADDELARILIEGQGWELVGKATVLRTELVRTRTGTSIFPICRKGPFTA
jgi:hypothetical protein